MPEMRRKDREIGAAEALEVVDRSEFATLATVNADGTPYCIPVSTVRRGDSVYFHCAKAGQKLENIERCPKVCISFVGDHSIPPDDTPEEIAAAKASPESFGRIAGKKFTTNFESAVIFGTATVVEDNAEKMDSLRRLCEKYSPGNMPYFEAAAGSAMNIMCIIRVDIERITGKRKK